MGGPQVSPWVPVVFLTIRWTSPSDTARCDVFGPWPVTDGSVAHLDDVRAFVARWQQVTGARAERLTITAPQDPSAWLAAREPAERPAPGRM